jgi:protein phosphatase
LRAPEQANPPRRALRNTRACGADRELHLDVVDGRLEPDDLFLLCSDGLTGMVDDAAIAAILSEVEPDIAAERLIEAALAAGGADNVSVIVVRHAPGLDEEQTRPRHKPGRAEVTK